MICSFLLLALYRFVSDTHPQPVFQIVETESDDAVRGRLQPLPNCHVNHRPRFAQQLNRSVPAHVIRMTTCFAT